VNPGRRIVAALLGADLTLFLAFFVAALGGHSATIVVPALALPWELSSAGLETIRWFPAAHLLAAILAVSSIMGETETIVAKVAAPAVVVSALVAATALIFGPICHSGLDSTQASSRRFSEYLATARVDLDSGNTDSAGVDLEILMSISKKDIRLADLDRRLAALRAKEAQNAETEMSTPPDHAAARTALGSARVFYAKGDWYNAHWQATLALRLDPSLVEAKRLAGLAWEEIAQATGSTPKDEAEATFFAEKFHGYGLLREGDYIGAWRVFDDLAKGHGADPEVRRYLRESLAGIDRTAFYRDEADSAFAAVSVPRFFLRYIGKSGNERVITAIDSGWIDGAAFFKDLEYIEVGPDGSATILSSPWAKAAEGRLFLVAADRTSPGRAFRPTAESVAPGGSSASAKRIDAPASIEIGLQAGELQLVAEARSEPAELGLSDAAIALAKTSAWGIASERLLTDVLGRLGVPFASFGTAIVGILLGLRFRPASPKIKRGFSVPSVPFLGLVTFGAWWIVDRLDNLASLWSARAMPDMNALWLSSAIRTLFIVLGVLLVADAAPVESQEQDDRE